MSRPPVQVKKWLLDLEYGEAGDDLPIREVFVAPLQAEISAMHVLCPPANILR